MTPPRAQQRNESSREKQWELQLTLPESSLLLEALIELPFKQVFELIGKLNHQAQQFYATDAASTTRQAFTVDSREFSCCVKALGGLPYSRVHELLGNLQQQLQKQQQEQQQQGARGDRTLDEES